MRAMCPEVSGEKFSPTENAGYSASQNRAFSGVNLNRDYVDLQNHSSYMYMYSLRNSYVKLYVRTHFM
jgi:hypothetical protein